MQHRKIIIQETQTATVAQSHVILITSLLRQSPTKRLHFSRLVERFDYVLK